MITKRKFINDINGALIAEYASDSGKLLRFKPTGALYDIIVHFAENDADIEETDELIVTEEHA